MASLYRNGIATNHDEIFRFRFDLRVRVLPIPGRRGEGKQREIRDIHAGIVRFTP